jgi:transcriptional regulator with XRE-family HTH domain
MTFKPDTSAKGARYGARTKTAELLALRLENLMARDKLSHRDLANRSGVAVRSIGDILSGRGDPRASTLVMLASSFNLHSIEELFGSLGSTAAIEEVASNAMQHHQLGQSTQLP